MSELLDITRQWLVDHMVEIVAHNIGLDFDFVLMVRTGSSYVLRCGTSCRPWSRRCG